MSYTAKSVILDIADNWGHAEYVGIRSIDFWYDGSKIANIETTDFVAYATTSIGAANAPWMGFDTSLSKTGAVNLVEWLSAGWSVSNQRLICVFNSEITFDEIRINDSHNSGFLTNRGIQNVKINISTDAITDTTYDVSISNSTLIYNSTFNEHAATDTEDEQNLTLIAPPATYGISGVVTEGGSPVERAVRAYLRSTGELLDTTTSNLTTGAYSFTVASTDEVFVIAFDNAAGADYNAVILDKIIPT